ncbi:MAG: hypothetical protein ABJA57_06130 [Ginsengibacter sp.]
MNSIAELKSEARSMLNEVNHRVERSPNGLEIFDSSFGNVNSKTDDSFMDRLLELRRQINQLSLPPLFTVI